MLNIVDEAYLSALSSQWLLNKVVANPPVKSQDRDPGKDRSDSR